MPSLPFSLPSFFCSICLPEINTFCLSCSLFQCSSAESKFSPKISLFHNNFRRKLFITYSVQSFQLFSFITTKMLFIELWLPLFLFWGQLSVLLFLLCGYVLSPSSCFLVFPFGFVFFSSFTMLCLHMVSFIFTLSCDYNASLMETKICFAFF